MLSDVLRQGRCLIPYLTYADPTPHDSELLMRAALDAGADVLEIGLPFSDPIADGPVIQASHQRALVHKPTLDQVFELVGRLKRDFSQPIVLMGSVNLIIRYGIERFFTECQKVSVDGVILPDLSFEEYSPFTAPAAMAGVSLISLISPLCRQDRLNAIVSQSTGFIYLMSTTGITGERHHLNTQLSGVVEKIKAIKPISVAIGFGINQPQQAQDVWGFAEGAIIGSYFVRLIASQPSVEEAVFVFKSEIQRFKA